jgi:hypothetical protein
MTAKKGNKHASSQLEEEGTILQQLLLLSQTVSLHQVHYYFIKINLNVA